MMNTPLELFYKKYKFFHYGFSWVPLVVYHEGHIWSNCVLIVVAWLLIAHNNGKLVTCPELKYGLVLGPKAILKTGCRIRLGLVTGILDSIHHQGNLLYRYHTAPRKFDVQLATLTIGDKTITTWQNIIFFQQVLISK